MVKKNHAKSSKLTEEEVGSGLAAVLAVIMAIGIVITWIVMFTKNEIPVALLPGLTFGMMIAVDVYVTTKAIGRLVTFAGSFHHQRGKS